ncbi:hypothetical protein [Nakamurella leprariae]|uniref:Uncharacterized protein n=1 Tax=Nakamurella leprariae TaxID=2803911 RepID=A0A938YF48_9ACTN|nr:hypothetical protein [Nakamurella leprariae]MBM9467272.1 hypothetical protein [Nakamurella leprariae]
MTDTAFLSAVLGVLVTLGGIVWAGVRFKSADYGNLQKDIESLRDRLHEVETEMRANEVRHRIEINHLDTEVLELRRGIEAGTIPPLPPRKPWPALPSAPAAAS